MCEEIQMTGNHQYQANVAPISSCRRCSALMDGEDLVLISVSRSVRARCYEDRHATCRRLNRATQVTTKANLIIVSLAPP